MADAREGTTGMIGKAINLARSGARQSLAAGATTPEWAG
jgi:hypothetical protein